MITVAEIKAKLPSAEVYELTNNCRYLLVVNRQSVSRSAVEALVQFLPMTCVLRVDDAEGAVKLLEVKESSDAT